MSVVRTRFAPSPTGSLHVGNARVAVLDWLFARRHGGRFLLRIEDTDADRNVPDAEFGILRDLRWLGLNWDEGPTWEGTPPPSPLGPFRQRDRLATYHAAAERLRSAGLAYECWCTQAQLDAMREAAIASGQPVRYDGRCRKLSGVRAAELRAQGRAPALRFAARAGGDIIVHDAIRGEVRFDAAEIGDFVLLRSDGAPTYNFAVVVDDIAMEITHVIRGAGHLSNTPRQLLLYEALEREPPVFAHMPMILSPDRQVLSKRHGARALADYRAEGYHPDALVNYLSLLSWSSPSGDEVLTRERLIAEVSLERIGAADAVFDETKLRWLSQQHIALMPLAALVAAVRPHVDAVRYPWALEQLPAIVAAVRTHLVTFRDIRDQLDAFEPPADAAAAMPRDDAEAATIAAILDRLRTLAEWRGPALDEAVRSAGKTTGVRGAALFQPLRRALTGREHGPALSALLEVRGRDDVLHSLDAALRNAQTRATE